MIRYGKCMVLVLVITYIILYISCVIPTFVSHPDVLSWFILQMNTSLPTLFKAVNNGTYICE